MVAAIMVSAQVYTVHCAVAQEQYILHILLYFLKLVLSA